MKGRKLSFLIAFVKLRISLYDKFYWTERITVGIS